MALTVTVAAGRRDLTTVEAVKDELGIAGSDTTEDFRLSEWIERASDGIRTYCGGRAFEQQTYQETLAGHGGTQLVLARAPIISVTSVAFQGQPVTDFSIADAEAGILQRDAGWSWTNAAFSRFELAPNPRGDLPSYTVIYVAGWKLPGEDGRTLPRDLEQACIDFVKYLREHRTGGGRVQSKSVGDLSITYFDEGAGEEADLPRAIAGALRGYRGAGF